MKHIISFLLMASISLILGSTMYAQHEDETKINIPELKQFHGTIYVLWHKAWPSRDYAKMKELYPKLDEGYKKLATAKLPGILRDKKAKWDAMIEALGATLNEYKTAAYANDTTTLLKKGELVHSQYEGLVRLIYPVLKEMDEFHQELYMLYHYYVPEYNFEKIKVSVDSLAKKMEILNAAKLPEKRKSKEEAFIKARKELSDTVDMLVKTVKENKSKEDIIKEVEKMHSKYQALEHIFE